MNYCGTCSFVSILHAGRCIRDQNTGSRALLALFGKTHSLSLSPHAQESFLQMRRILVSLERAASTIPNPNVNFFWIREKRYPVKIEQKKSKAARKTILHLMA